MRVSLQLAASAAVVALAWWPLARRRRRRDPRVSPGDRPRGPRNLLAVLFDAYWRSLADDPLATLLLMALLSLAGVLLVLLWYVAVYLFAQLAAVL
ncbi:MAG TPA: hypothetical protein VFL71_10800 [Actinomycetes bacterium]|nr:hypothetical protein [Actinomycetes bacterium]